MPKSNYPNKLDTSVEIPTVRDNITEIGSDVLNSLRSAIFNIEKTLGINPNGAAGQTLASRLSNIIDENGFLRKEAIDRIGLLSGPVSDGDIAKTAGIKEFKLDLDFPTGLLQDEISILNTKIEQFVIAIEELNKLISVHVNPASLNRHGAGAITLEANSTPASDNALNELESTDLQSFIESLFSSHIFYSGTLISESNNSHSANQIFFDKNNNSDLIFSDSVQGAIDDLANLEGDGLRASILNLNSNGRIRTGDLRDSFGGSDFGITIVDASDITYLTYAGSSRTTISFTNAPTPNFDISKFDVLEIQGSSNEEDDKDYIIASHTLNGDGTLSTVDVFGGPHYSFETGTTGLIKRSLYQNYNQNGLNSSVRPRALYTNNPIIQISLPNAATVFSSGARPSKLESGASETIAVKLDDDITHEIPVYNSDYSRQTLDTVIATFNRYCASNNLNIFAYKSKSLNCFELSISHNIPDYSADAKRRSIEIVDASSSDASDQLGLSYMKNRVVYGQSGNNFHINGKLLSNFGLTKKFDGDSVSLVSGLTSISSSSLSFTEEGVRIGDLCVVDGSSNDSDNGTYVVTSVSSNQVELDYTGNTFSGTIDSSSAVFFIRSSAPISELNFVEPSSSILLDIFVDENLDIFYKKRIDITGSISSSNFYLVLKDVSKGFISLDEEFTITVNSNGNATLKKEPTGIAGEEHFVGTSGDHKIFSADGMEFVTVSVFVPDESSPIFASGTLSSTLVGFGELPSSVYHVSRCLFSPEFGIVIDDSNAGSGEVGAPSVIDKRISGTIDDTIISEAFIERYIWGPNNEVRSNGTIRGLEVSNFSDSSGSCVVDISPGVATVGGSRFEYLGDSSLPYNYSGGSTNNFYIAMDRNGCIVIGNEVDKTGGTNYISPFLHTDVLHLAYIEPSSGSIKDLRLFIDRNDYKISREIIVSNDQNFGHFTSLEKAVDYCRLYSKIYKNLDPPSIFIKEGIHEVDKEIYINFDISIRGSGPKSIIKRSPEHELFSSNISYENPDYSVFYLSYNSLDTDVQYGIHISDLTYVGLEGQDPSTGGSVVRITHNVNTAGFSENVFITIRNMRFIAADDYAISASSDLSAGATGPNEYPINIGAGTSGQYQNIIIENCYFYKMGWEQGVVYLNSSNDYKNISVINCISTGSIASSYSLIRSGGGSSTYQNVSEINSMIN